MKDFYIVGEITQLTAREFVEFLQEAKNGEMTLHINSGGGDIFSALAISNLIKNKKVTVKVEGLAASAATLILCGAAKVVSAKNALFMMHLPLVEMDSSYNAEELAKLQRGLERRGRRNVLAEIEDRRGGDRRNVNRRRMARRGVGA